MHDALYRPRAASEIVDAGFQLLRRNYRAYVTITAITYAPVLVALLVLQRALGVTPARAERGVHGGACSASRSCGTRSPPARSPSPRPTPTPAGR